MNIKKILGDNIRYYRKEIGLTQETLSKKLNITAKHLSNIESGHKFVSAEILQKIIIVLGVKPSALFYSKDNKGIEHPDISEIDILIDEFSNELKKRIREQS